MRLSSSPRRLAVAFLTTVIVAGAGAASVSAGPPEQPSTSPSTLPPPPPPPVSPAGATTVPGGAPGTMPIVDDLRTLTIEVPSSWSDVSTVPGTAADGSQYPQIIASTNIASFQNSFDTSGVFYLAQPLNPDSAAGLAASFDFSGQCTDGGAQPYRDAYFTGTTQTWTACGGGQGKVVTVFATPTDQRFSVALLVGIATPAEEDATALALASFFVTKPQGGAGATAGGSPASTAVPGATVTPPTVPVLPEPTTGPSSAPAVPGGSTVPVAPSGASGDPVILEDDTGTIGVGVPPAWTEVNTSPASDAQNQQVPAISAAPDLATFNSGQGVGMFMVAAPYVTDLQSVLPTLAPQGCQGGTAAPYQDEFFTGVTQTFANCGGVTVTTLAANRTGNTRATIQIIVATMPGDDSPLQMVVSTFDFTPEAR